MTETDRRRTTSKTVATKPGCAPLKLMYDEAVTARPKAWSQVESGFLSAMEAFDANLVNGLADMGDLQNGKGDFFNDLLALLLENCAGTTLYSRGGVPGLIFSKHHLDVTFPSVGVAEFMLEAKAVGTPKHGGSPKARPIGRPGSADLDKRIKEIAFKAIDLKAEYARIQAEQGGQPTAIAGNLTTWLRSVRPRSYVFIAARVTGQKDHARVVRFANVAAQVSDAVGVYCYSPATPSEPTKYKPLPVPTHVELARVLFQACQDLLELKRIQPRQAPSPSPSTVAEETDLGEEDTR